MYNAGGGTSDGLKPTIARGERGAASAQRMASAAPAEWPATSATGATCNASSSASTPWRCTAA